MENKPNSKIAEEKLMILYIIKKSNSTLNQQQLTNLVLEYDLLNYFTFVEYLNDLLDSNFLEKLGGPEIKLTDFSLQVLELLEENISIEKRTKIDGIFETNDNSEYYSNSQLIPLEDGRCILRLSVSKDLDEQFNLQFTVNSLNEGKLIEKKWKNKNRSLYNELIRVLKEAIK